MASRIVVIKDSRTLCNIMITLFSLLVNITNENILARFSTCVPRWRESGSGGRCVRIQPRIVATRAIPRLTPHSACPSVPNRPRGGSFRALPLRGRETTSDSSSERAPRNAALNLFAHSPPLLLVGNNHHLDVERFFHGGGFIFLEGERGGGGIF